MQTPREAAAGSGDAIESPTDVPPSRVGDVEIWWLQTPGLARLSIWGAMWLWLLLAPATAATLGWIASRGESSWPYGHDEPSPAQQLLKYLIVLAVFVVYATALSIRVWWQSLRPAAADARAIPGLIAAGRWSEAARVLHRYCLLCGTIWRRIPRRAAVWDAQIRPHLSSCRRLYVYYRRTPPPLPEDPTSSFAPEVVAVGTPTIWSVMALVPLFGLLYYLVEFAAESGEWARLLHPNALLIAALLLGYGTFYTLVLLGRVSYVRLAPGVAQWIRFSALRRPPAIETLALRGYDATLDTTTPRYRFRLTERRQTRVACAFQLPPTADVATACMRAVLSQAPIPPLPEDPLEG